MCIASVKEYYMAALESCSEYQAQRDPFGSLVILVLAQGSSTAHGCQWIPGPPLGTLQAHT